MKKKLVLVAVLCFVCFGCGTDTSNLKQELMKYVQSETAANIIDKLDKSVNNIMMFPEKKVEDEFIYLVGAIKENISKFTEEELKDIYDKLQIQYDFNFNDLKYSEKDYENDLDTIEDAIEKEENEE